MQTRTLATAVGLIVAACGPLPPIGGSGESATEGGETTTSTPTTGAPTTGEPETSGSGSGSSDTTDPPECVDSSDCSYGECSYCINGKCEYSPGCCGLMPGPGGDLQFRCIGYECYSDDECSDGHFCEGAPGFCSPIQAIPVCDKQDLVLAGLGLAGTPSALALLDVDGDGNLDVVATLPDAALVEVALGDGHGEFTSTTFPTKLEPGAHRIAWADFDGDADPDLAISRPVPTGELSLLFGQDAVFADPVLINLGATPGEVWAGDVDGDGKADLVAHNQDGAAPLTLRLGDGLGGFGEELGGDQLNGEGFAAAAGDIDGDKALEIVTNVMFAPRLRALEFQGGGFSGGELPSFKGNVAQETIRVVDLDGDAVGEIVAHRSAPDVSGIVTVWKSQAPVAELVLDVAVQLGPVGDFDGDGTADLVTLEPDPTVARVIFMGGTHCTESFQLPGEKPTAPELMAAGDVDGDGKADLLAGTFTGPNVVLLRSQL